MHLYGLIIGIAIIIGIQYFSKHQTFLKPKQVDIFAYSIIIIALIGARTYHVLDSFSYYSQHPNLIIATWNGGMGIFGGIIAALAFIIIFARLKKVPILLVLDSITPILPLCQAIGRLGNFINQEIPTWWIEALLNLSLFFYIKKFPQNPTAKYLIGYGVIRFLLEFLRQDTWTIGSVKIGQVISIILIMAGLLIIKRNKILK